MSDPPNYGDNEVSVIRTDEDEVTIRMPLYVCNAMSQALANAGHESQDQGWSDFSKSLNLAARTTQW